MALFSTVVLPKSITPAICLPSTLCISYLPLSPITVFYFLSLSTFFRSCPKPISSVKPYLQISSDFFFPCVNSQSLMIFNTPFHTIYGRCCYFSCKDLTSPNRIINSGWHYSVLTLFRKLSSPITLPCTEWVVGRLIHRKEVESEGTVCLSHCLWTEDLIAKMYPFAIIFVKEDGKSVSGGWISDWQVQDS